MQLRLTEPLQSTVFDSLSQTTSHFLLQAEVGMLRGLVATQVTARRIHLISFSCSSTLWESKD